MRSWNVIVAVLCSSMCASTVGGQAPTERQQEYLKFIKAEAAKLRALDKPPATREEWEARRGEIRKHLQHAFGTVPEKPCPLEPKVLGVLQRDGYRVEKIIFQTMPGVWMTASAYVPDRPGKHPALLAVHGHWRGARLDPVLQKRCIGPAKLGYFVLAVDAFGAGERGIGKALGEYHGEMTAATLLPTGMTLAGLQVYENMRAVDYLRSRPEVDGTKIAITGASGGGNQTMYAGAWDERFGAVVPVCSVGTYHSYLGVACCMCEVVPGAMRFTEEGGILGLTAPRGLMVINATKDGIQFSVGEAKKSLAFASDVYKVFGKADHVRHTIFDWHHDYSQAMREALYGWLAKHLKGEGDGSPIPDPPMKSEDPETLRCFPGDTRPADWMTIPKFAAAEGRRLLQARRTIDTVESWNRDAANARKALAEKVLGDFPAKGPLEAETIGRIDDAEIIDFRPEPGLKISAAWKAAAKGNQSPLAIRIALDATGGWKFVNKLDKPFHLSALKDWNLARPELRATVTSAWPGDKIGAAPDHNSAQWGLWIGRPLLGQWVHDVRRLLDVIEARDGKLPSRVAVIGDGAAGVVALCAAAIDSRITDVVAIEALSSYVSDSPYKNQRLGLMAPGILREVGDVAHLAALCLPRRVVVAGGVWGDGTKLTPQQLQTTFEPAARVSKLLGKTDALQLLDADDAEKIIKALR